MRIILEAISAATSAEGVEVVQFDSMSALVGQSILTALLTRLPAVALGRVRESYPATEKTKGMPGELLVTITLDGSLPAWAREIFA